MTAINTRPRERGFTGFTLIELMLVMTVTGILSAIAVPSLTRARGVSLETSTIGLLRTLHTAQAAYAVSCAGGYYAPSILVLRTAPTAGGPPFLGSPELNADTTDRYGYRIRFSRGTVVARAPRTCNGLAQGRTADGYFVGADLLQVSHGITRYFGIHGGGVMYQSRSRVRPLFSGVPPSPARPIE